MLKDIEKVNFNLMLGMLCVKANLDDGLLLVQDIVNGKKKLTRKRLTKRDKKILTLGLIEYLAMNRLLADFCKYWMDNTLNDKLLECENALLVFCKYVIDKINKPKEMEKLLSKCVLLNGYLHNFEKINNDILLFVIIDFVKEIDLFDT